MMRTILYTRVSTSSQEEKGTSLESQIEALGKYVKASGYQVLKHISDTHSGADLWNRPGISNAREAVRARQVDVILAYSIDRLSRDPAHLIILLDECERYGARLEFVTERMEDSQEWKLIQYVKGYAAAIEREKIKERSVRGKRQKLLQGKLMQAGVTLYGYRHIKAEGRREIYEPEAAIVRRIFKEIIAGKSLRYMVNKLNTEGVPSPSSGKRQYKDGHTPLWGPSQLKTIINEPSYYGNLTAGRWRSEGKGRIVKRPDNEHISLASELSPAIIGEDTFKRAQEALKRNTGVNTRNEVRPCLLRGLVRCAKCRRNMTPKDPYRYQCNSNNRIKALFCGARDVKRGALEAWVWEVISELYTDPTRILERAVERDASGSSKATVMRQLAEKQKEIVQLEGKIAKVLRTVTLSDDPAVEAMAVKQLKELGAEVKRVKEEIAALQANHIEAQDFDKRVERMVERLSANTRLPETILERHALLVALGVQVIADEKNWSISLPFIAEEGTGHVVQKTSVFETQRLIEIARFAA